VFDCKDCVLRDRREFVRDVVGSFGAALATIGLEPAMAASLPVQWVAGFMQTAGEARYPMPAADGVQIDRDNQVILVRSNNVIYAFDLSCPHQNTALRWDDADGRFQCPKHHSKYQPDGTFISGRATRNMDRLAIRRDGDSVVVDLDAMYKSDHDQAGWAAAAVRL
jgi:nitrite reductase/ring-hydroxylating ferredoxin subunit